MLKGMVEVVVVVDVGVPVINASTEASTTSMV